MIRACIFMLMLGIWQNPANKESKFSPPESIAISINSSTSEILFNSKPVHCMCIDSLTMLLGKPSRVEKYTRQERYERWSYKDGEPPTSSMKEMTDYYYLYDNLGIMFYTNLGWGKEQKPCSMAIFFGNKRNFDNRKQHPFTPKKAFPGTLTFNDNLLEPTKKLVPESVDYNTKETQIFNTSFGPTSIGGVIDGFYSTSSRVYMLIYLDQPETQRPAYIEIGLGE
ncbi:MAG: hypothetical protein V2A54_08085 [Bacteroidota bacterium]